VSEDRAAVELSRPISRSLARDAAALLGFSAALAVAVGVIKTPMHVPGHSALFWMPILVLAGSHRRPGMAVGSAALGGAMASLWGGVGGLDFGCLLAAAALVQACALARSPESRGTWMLAAGVLGHLGKLGIKVLASVAAGLPLNHTGLLLLPTLGLYLAFGLMGGSLAWGALAASRRLGRADDHGSSEES
jgi:hypothetical protein